MIRTLSKVPLRHLLSHRLLPRHSRVPVLVGVLATSLLAACGGDPGTAPMTAFTGATVWDGTGDSPVPDATIVVQEGRVVSIEAGGEVPAGAEQVDLAGTFVTPGLVNAHGHVTGLWAPPEVTDEVERIRGDLELFARYGVTTVNSLGDGDAALAARDSARPRDPRARLQAAGPVITATDPDEARRAAEANVDAGVDWLKLRVDDNLGTSEKMPWPAVQAVLAVGSERDVPVATHVFYLDDAKRLLEMGSQMIAHSVRDRPVDDAFIQLLRDTGVCYVPTLTREVSTFVYADRPSFFDDPFFTRHADPEQVARASDPDFMQGMAESPTAAGYRQALEQALANVATLVEAGIPVAMGTDAGPPARFPGYFEHLELWMMVDAGLSPLQALRSATSVAADCARVPDVGTLEPGRWADFAVFRESPWDDIRNTRSLDRVFVAGRLLE